MSSSSTPKPEAALRGSNKPVRDGFLPLSEALFHADIPPAMADGDMSREDLARAQFELVKALNWPFVSENLVSGRMPTYAFLPDRSMLYIDRRHWAQIAHEHMPDVIECGLSEPMEPYVRLGDVEWLLTTFSPSLMWTADQALIWITTRDMQLVKSASPWMGSRRLTWVQFLTSTVPSVMPRVSAMQGLRMDLGFETLTAWSGRRPFDPKLAGLCKWDRAETDPLAYCALRGSWGELHAIMLQAEQVQARYPAPEASEANDAVSGEAVAAVPIEPPVALPAPVADEPTKKRQGTKSFALAAIINHHYPDGIPISASNPDVMAEIKGSLGPDLRDADPKTFIRAISAARKK